MPEPGATLPSTDRRTILHRLAAGASHPPRLRWASTGCLAAGIGDAAPSQSPGPSLVTRQVASTGERVPVVGLGTWQTFDVGRDAEARSRLGDVLRTFVDAGGRLIDSSPMYGRAEEVVGDLAVGLGVQSRLFIATKVWTTGKASGIRQMEESMRKLRTARIDLMQVHNLVDAAAHLDTLRGWQREGRVRYIGVTHYTAAGQADIARLIERTPVDWIQINYSIAERQAERRLLPLARERGIAVIANRPFAGGELLRELRGRPLPGWAAEIDCQSWAQVLLKFAVSQPAVTCAIPATSNAAHLRDNMQAAYGRMPDEALRERIVMEVG
jgi:diketogulonate reductase-like aldo/keto reductase